MCPATLVSTTAPGRTDQCLICPHERRAVPSSSMDCRTCGRTRASRRDMPSPGGPRTSRARMRLTVSTSGERRVGRSSSTSGERRVGRAALLLLAVALVQRGVRRRARIGFVRRQLLRLSSRERHASRYDDEKLDTLCIGRGGTWARARCVIPLRTRAARTRAARTAPRRRRTAPSAAARARPAPRRIRGIGARPALPCVVLSSSHSRHASRDDETLGTLCIGRCGTWAGARHGIPRARARARRLVCGSRMRFWTARGAHCRTARSACGHSRARALLFAHPCCHLWPRGASRASWGLGRRAGPCRGVEPDGAVACGVARCRARCGEVGT